MTKPVVCFFTSVLSHSKKYLNVSSRNRVEEKVRLRHTQPTSCTMQLHNAQCIVQHTQSTYVQCKNNNLVQCAECITMQDTHAHNCIVQSALCALCIVQSQSSVVWRLWQYDLQVRGSFLPSLSPPPLKRQTRCTLVHQAVLFAPHSSSLAYLYRGLQEIGEGSIFSHLKLYLCWTHSCEAQRD